MSATGRGTVRDEKDFYATPKAAFAPLLNILPYGVRYWEPCAGDGRLIRWLHDSARFAEGADLFPQAAFPCMSIDYLQDDTHRDFVITNPPFGVAFEMCQHARRHSDEFMFLLRLSFLESDDRGDWLSANEPSALFVLRKRPSFVMSVTCKMPSPPREKATDEPVPPCKHNFILPIESPRPKTCPKCGGGKIAISSSDNSGYAWFYWGHRFTGIHHI